MTPDLVNGILPQGRWHCELSDLDKYHNLPNAERRKKIWSDFERVLELARASVGEVAACWLGGSYFTDKENPGDLDCIFIIEEERIAAARQSPNASRILGIIAGNGSKDALEAEVDSFVLSWKPRPGALPGKSPARDEYLKYRGYWDDLWIRQRVGSAKDQSVPSRGYLEVSIDGFKRV